MNIKIETVVSANLEEVISRFDQDLFSQLNPPFPPVKLIRFDGSEKGDIVMLELNFLLFKQKWISEILEESREEKAWYFVDHGTKLPFFLKYWQHRHLAREEKNGTRITDDITFKTPFLLFDFLMYPILYLQFLYRKPIYKRYFHNTSKA